MYFDEKCFRPILKQEKRTWLAFAARPASHRPAEPTVMRFLRVQKIGFLGGLLEPLFEKMVLNIGILRCLSQIFRAC